MWQTAAVIEMSLPAHHLQVDLWYWLHREAIDIVGTIGVRIRRRNGNRIEGSTSKCFMIILGTSEPSHLFKLASRGFYKTPIHAGSEISYLRHS
jgi:hypothetical protein